MKIGIDASRFRDSQATGVEWYSWHIINGILEENAKKNSPDELVLYSREGLVFDDKFRGDIKNVVIERKRLWTLLGLSREMRKNPPDVLFVPSHTFPLSLPRKSVITIHDLAFRYLRKSYSFFQYHYLNWSTKFAVRKASKIVVPSEATKKDLIEIFDCEERKIEVVAHGFEVPGEVDESVMETSEIFKYFQIKADTKYILFVGRLETKKNLVRLVEAFGKFSEKNPDYLLVLAGKRGFGFNKIWRRVNELKLAEKVAMPGYITQEEKAVLYKNSRMFAFPSLYEGFGLPILEAFHYGKPVLCSSVSSLPEVGGEAVHYVDPYDVDSIAEGLGILAIDDGYVKGLVERGLIRLKEFSWEKAAKRTLEILHLQEKVAKFCHG